MDKISFQVTINALTSPELLQHLRSIDSPRHRSEVLRRLAEIGLGVMAPVTASSQSIGQYTAAQVAPSRSKRDSPDDAAIITEIPADPGKAHETVTFNPSHVPPEPPQLAPSNRQPETPGLAVQDAGASVNPTPSSFAHELNLAMDRFF
ncbi:hypothetical protein AWV80_28335 [Cupriavidus sp. UYMU48A]|nr:hypothetical protein AWV80_28335 [Cupriavidus sp. UYMU48A]